MVAFLMRLPIVGRPLGRSSCLARGAPRAAKQVRHCAATEQPRRPRPQRQRRANTAPSLLSAHPEPQPRGVPQAGTAGCATKAVDRRQTGVSIESLAWMDQPVERPGRTGTCADTWGAWQCVGFH